MDIVKVMNRREKFLKDKDKLIALKYPVYPYSEVEKVFANNPIDEAIFYTDKRRFISGLRPVYFWLNPMFCNSDRYLECIRHLAKKKVEKHDTSIATIDPDGTFSIDTITTTQCRLSPARNSIQIGEGSLEVTFADGRRTMMLHGVSSVNVQEEETERQKQ